MQRRLQREITTSGVKATARITTRGRGLHRKKHRFYSEKQREEQHRNPSDEEYGNERGQQRERNVIGRATAEHTAKGGPIGRVMQRESSACGNTKARKGLDVRVHPKTAE